jgi:hypothetical protein
MGFLRKVGRKVNKKLNKVFGEKVGGIIGMVGLYFAMGAVAKQLTGWAKSTFGAGKSTAQAANVAQQASDIGQATLDAKSAADTTAIATEAAKKGVDATVTSTGASVETLIAESTTNAEKFNSWVGGQESLLNQGKLPVEVNPSLTDTVVNSISNEEVYKQTTGEVFKYLEQPALDVNKIAESVKTAEQAAAPLTNVDFKELEGMFEGSRLTPTEGSSFAQAAAKPTRYASLPTDATFGEKFGRFTGDPVGMSTEFVRSKAAKAGDYITGEFVPDLAQGALTGAVNRSLMEDEEVMGLGRGAQGQPMMTAAQGNHLAAVQAQPGYANLTNMRSFTDLANQTLYGTGSPSYLQNVYQPIKI